MIFCHSFLIRRYLSKILSEESQHPRSYLGWYPLHAESVISAKALRQGSVLVCSASFQEACVAKADGWRRPVRDEWRGVAGIQISWALVSYCKCCVLALILRQKDFRESWTKETYIIDTLKRSLRCVSGSTTGQGRSRKEATQPARVPPLPAGEKQKGGSVCCLLHPIRHPAYALGKKSSPRPQAPNPVSS